MPTVTANARELLTPEQQELYDGVLTECKQNRETAVAVRPLRPPRGGAGSRCDGGEGGAVRRRSCWDGDCWEDLMNEESQAHPSWCAHSHPPDGAHSSEPITLDQGEVSYTGAVLYLWQPPESPVMVAAELSGDGDEETMLYLLSIGQGRRLGEAVERLLGLLQ